MTHREIQIIPDVIAQEAAAESACYRAAEKYGVTTEKADECDDGDVGCPDCPWKKK